MPTEGNPEPRPLLLAPQLLWRMPSQLGHAAEDHGDVARRTMGHRDTRSVEKYAKLGSSAIRAGLAATRARASWIEISVVALISARSYSLICRSQSSTSAADMGRTFWGRSELRRLVAM